jgi:Domain of unknown function (DUF397)
VSSNPTWRKSTHSGTQQGDCVEVADLGGIIGIRDSKAPDAGHLAVPAEHFADLVARVKHSAYDVT